MAPVSSLRAMYLVEMRSIPDIADAVGMPRSKVRTSLMNEGVQLRTRSEGIKLKSAHLSTVRTGKTRTFTKEWKSNISAGRLAWGEKNAKGTCLASNGYVIFTRGPNKGRGEHVVVMEARLGRRLKPDEEVHHIDEVRHNNAENNLALVTCGAHKRIHHFMKKNRGEQ